MEARPQHRRASATRLRVDEPTPRPPYACLPADHPALRGMAADNPRRSVQGLEGLEGGDLFTMGMAGEDAHVAGALTAIVRRAGRFLKQCPTLYKGLATRLASRAPWHRAISCQV